jgi:cytoskeletal protein CcmA (bactofilin family)
MSRMDRSVSERVSFLGPKSVVNGDFSTSEELVILGKLDGKFVKSPRITIGPTALVHAEIHTSHIRIEGVVTGDIYAATGVIVHASATVHGNIHCPQITIQEGAHVNGALNYEAIPKALDLEPAARTVRPKASKTA